MSQETIYAIPNLAAHNRPIIFNHEICNGCNICVQVCQMDVLIPNSEKGSPPIVLHPDECWYDGCCVAECPRPGAAIFSHPLMQRVRWKRKESGEHFRV